MKRKAIIFGIKGYYLSRAEKTLFRKYKPWGVILFSRNIKNLEKLKKLIINIRKVTSDINYPILIDQEGGRVSRINKIIDLSLFSQGFFGKMYSTKSKKYFYTSYKIYIDAISQIFNYVGININTVPVLDLRRIKSHNIIGDRSYSSNKKLVTKIGDICIEKFHKNRIATIIKHIPGHGLAISDSHKKLPIIYKNIEYLIRNDFQTFKNKKSLIAMTGHLLFKKIDRNETVTHSKKMINLIRNKIGFKNILITDDLSMKALKYSLEENVKKSFLAGCNLALHCNGNLKQMLIVAKNSPKINNFILKKTSQLSDIIS